MSAIKEVGLFEKENQNIKGNFIDLLNHQLKDVKVDFSENYTNDVLEPLGKVAENYTISKELG